MRHGAFAAVLVVLATRAAGARREMSADLDVELTGSRAEGRAHRQAALSRSALTAGMLISGRFELVKEVSSEEEGIPWPDDLGDFQKIKRIGHGAFGVIFLARDRRHQNREVAIKFFALEDGETFLSYTGAVDEEERGILETAHAECAAPDLILKARNDCPRCRKLFTLCYEDNVDDPEHAYIVMQNAGEITLRQFVEQKGLPPPIVMADVLKQLMLGLKQMQGQWVHRDIKPDNVCVTKVESSDRLQLKLVDLGLIIEEGKENEALGGTPGYLPPEIFPTTPADYRPSWKHDLYATGATILRLICGETVYGHALKLFTQLERQSRSEMQSLFDDMLPDRLCTAPEGYRKIKEFVAGYLMGPQNDLRKADELLSMGAFKELFD